MMEVCEKAFRLICILCFILAPAASLFSIIPEIRDNEISMATVVLILIILGDNQVQKKHLLTSRVLVLITVGWTAISIALTITIVAMNGLNKGEALQIIWIAILVCVLFYYLPLLIKVLRQGKSKNYITE